jgi:two-component system, chemotaxis family, CheB/CheR fusion protein
MMPRRPKSGRKAGRPSPPVDSHSDEDKGTSTPKPARLRKPSTRTSVELGPKTELSSPEPPHTQIPTVGIGASAGGLEAFQRLIQHLPSNTGLAYVIVSHLDPAHESLLPELLARGSAIPVVQAMDGMRLNTDRAHVIPPNMTMTVAEGHLRLVARKKGRGLHLPIDALLTSLAMTQGSSAVGVILSGAGSDGMRGIQAIKEAGGITIAQDSASAHFTSMPQSAVDSGAVDFVLTPEQIANQLARLGGHLARHPEDVGGTGDEEVSPDESALRKILALLHKRTGVDFQYYRRGTLHRRILRRMLANQQETRSDYLAHLRANPAELDLLYEDLLIGVTRFFRDAEVFATLRDIGFPAIMLGHRPDSPVRIWVPGCAGGQEAYSLAIALIEFLGEDASDVPIQVFGTDLSEASIAEARAGLYPETITDQVSPERLRRFFHHEDNGYRITKAVRDLCVFSRQNVVRDPPFSHLDLVSCRNVLIYLETALQRRVLPTFHFALEPSGLLLLGNAESVGPSSELFEPLAKQHGLYRRRTTAVRPIDVDALGVTDPPAMRGAPRRGPVRSVSLSPSTDEIESEADRLVLAQFTPPGVVINEYMEILQFRGDTGSFLAHPPGMASLELLRLARPELVMPLQAAIRGARVSGRPSREEGIALPDGDVSRRITIDVLPFRPPSTRVQFFVVSFSAVSAGEHSPPVAAAEPGPVSAPAGPRRGRGRAGTDELTPVRQELATTKRYLQDIVEQHEATTEELRAANEEIQASNEELQSANEELETTKEEVQSTNEELTTLNEELLHRNRELSGLAGDLSNILASTTIPIVIVASDFKLRRFTPASERVMRVMVSDVGRPLGDIKLRVALPDLERQITSVIETLTVVEQEVRDDDGHWWALTIRPYQTIDHRVDGAVLVFADIDASKRYGDRESEISEARRQLLDVAETGRITADEARKVAEMANRAKSAFLASMSHDLRTPLNAISGYTDLLEHGVRGPVTDAQMLDLGRIKSSSRYLLSLINDILNFAKVEAGHVNIRLADVSIEALVAEVHDLLAPQLVARSLQFERANTDTVVRADPDKVQQILLNLLSNALKFTPLEGQIGIDCVATADAVRVEVWDMGCGIAEAHLEHIFEPFVQVNRGLTSPAPGGVGLGLAISRELARAMHGDLAVTSTLGHGSRFVLTLPRVP